MTNAPEGQNQAGRSELSLPDPIPDVPAVLLPGRYQIDCPFCGKHHYHGRGGGLGLRVAHCGRGQYSLIGGAS